MQVDVPGGLSPKLLELLKQNQGEPVASDRYSAIYDRASEISAKLMKEIASESGGPVSVSLRTPGERKTIDGIVYEVDSEGSWKAVEVL